VIGEPCSEVIAMRRRVLAISSCLLWSTLASAGPGDPACALDFDGSGIVDQGDLDYCAGVIVPPGSPHPCDTNGDGLFTTLEVGQLLDAIARGTIDCTVAVPLTSPATRLLLPAVLALAGVWAGGRMRRRTGVH
jgi:hypothetical protein